MRSLIVGHYGSANYGDDVMLAELINEVKLETQNECRVIFFGPYSDGFYLKPDERLHIDRYNRLSFLILYVKSLIWADKIVWGGGTCFTDEEGDGFFIGMLMAFLFRVRISYRSIGIGNLTRISRQLKFAILMRIADTVTFRDKKSLSLAQTLYSRQYGYEQDLGEAHLSKNNLDGAKENYLVLAWRDLEAYGDIEVPLDKVASYVALYSQHNDIEKIVIMNADSIVDVNIGNSLFQAMSSMNSIKVDYFNNPSFVDKTNLIRNASHVITARLHVMVAAAMFDVKFRAYAYSPKLTYAAEALGCLDSLVGKNKF